MLQLRESIVSNDIHFQVKVERDGRMVVEYGLVMKDMYSGYMWHAQLRSKDEVANYVAVLVRQAETQFVL